jgi:hypothetical protein
MYGNTSFYLFMVNVATLSETQTTERSMTSE